MHSDLDTVGWDSSTTGRAIPEPEMREWVERAVARILATRPRRVLEIGCGTGLILERVARCCEQITGNDFSRRAIDDLRARLAGRPDLADVRLECREANDFTGVAAGAFDTVVLNSVAQYFPSIDYLLEVLRGAAEATAPGGAIFIGDVRSLPLLDAFCAAVEVHSAAGSCTLDELAQRVRQRRWRERELVVDPAFFHALGEELPRLAGVRIEPKGGRSSNELTRFRYDVTLRLDSPPAAAASPRRGARRETVWLDWRRGGWTLAALRRHLATRSPAILGLRRVPNARLTRMIRLLEALARPERGDLTVAELETVLVQPGAGAAEPEDFEDLARELGYRARISWGASWPDGACDVIFEGSSDAVPATERAAAAADDPRPAAPRRGLSAYANNPLRDRWAQRLVPAVREHVRRRLPDSMMPSLFVVLDALPLSPTGKVDRGTLRRRLPPPAPTAGDGAHAAPRNDVEEILAEIWCRVLGRDRVGVHDNFFDLGGHSLLATQVVSRLRETFQVEIPVRRLFDQPTVAGLATSLLDARRGSSGVATPKIEPAPRGAPLPLSFAQRRLWFLSQLEPTVPWYNLATPLRLRGPLEVSALIATLDEIVRRHQVLRTRFELRDGRPVQRIASPGTGANGAEAPATGDGTGSPLPLVDLTWLAEGDRDAEARRLMQAEERRLFDLEQDPPLRASLLRIRGGEHLLLVIFHHIVADGWSQQLFRRELGTLYEAFSRRRPSPLPELPVQYADFASWQRQRLDDDRLDRHLAYWTARLADPPPALELPADRPRPAIQRHAGATVPWRLPAATAAPLAALCRDQGASPFMVLAAGFMTWIHRLTGRRDVVVGTPIAGRNHEQIEGLIGCFFNTLALRQHLVRGDSFLDLVRSVRGTALDAYAHQDLPFEKLVEVLQPDRALSRHPLFQVSLALLNVPRAEPRAGDLEVSAIAAGSHTVRLDLEIYLHEAADGMAGQLLYDTSLFDATTAARMSHQLRTLLAAGAGDPRARLMDLPLLARAQRHQLRVEWSAALPSRQRDLPPNMPPDVHQLVARWATRTPDRVAVIWEPPGGGVEALSYRQLDRRAGELAHRLRACRVAAEDLVGLTLDRTPEMVVGVLGILRAGSAYLPLDPTSPARRRRQILEDARVAALVTRKELLPPGLPDTIAPLFMGKAGETVSSASRDKARLRASGARYLRLRASGARYLRLRASGARYLRLRASGATSRPRIGARGGQLAYVVHTSGSTGRPKGVMVNQRAVVNAFHGWRSAYRLRSGADRHLQMASLGFDVFTGDLVRALGAGGTLVICPRERLLEPARLHALIRRQRIDCAEFVPAVALPLASHLRRTGGDLACLRLLIVGSDHWTRRQLAELADVTGPRTRIVNSYGVSEATIDSSFYDAGKAAAEDDRPVSIGRPFAGTGLYVLGRRLDPLPAAAPGELCIAGAGLARGYLDRPALTAELFVPNPHGRPGSRLYRTGDRARFLPDGTLELRGRLDHQVKIRGFRVELGEIEATLREHPGIADAAVVLGNGTNAGAGDRRLVAFLAPASSTSTSGPAPSVPERPDLRAFLARRLPDHMIPATYVTLDALPRNRSGKVDRPALARRRPAAGDLLSSALPAAPPRTPYEMALAEIWRDVLGVEDLGIDDGFFALGGHSLLAVRLMARIERRLGVRLPLASLFRGATVKEQAARLLELRDQESLVVALPSAAGNGSEPKFFCIHPAGGNVLCYAALAHHLDGGHGFYAVQARGHDGRAPFLSDLPAMARCYLESIRELQPHGPYLLGGWSMGGVVAFEMATQLRRLGEQVALLALIDSAAPDPAPPVASDTAASDNAASDNAASDNAASDNAASLRAFALHLGLAPDGPRLAGERLASLGHDQGLREIVDQARREALISGADALPRLSHLYALFRNNVRTLGGYSPAFYPGEITLFQAREGGRDDPARSWRARATRVTLTAVPGDHFSMLREPHVATLAAGLSRCLETCRTARDFPRVQPIPAMEEEHEN